MKRSRLRSTRKRRDTADVAAALAWHRTVTARGCQVCPEEGGVCSGVVVGHHIVYQQHCRSWVDAEAHRLGLTKEEKMLLERRVVWDIRDGMGVCHWRHEQHHSRHRPIPFGLVPLPALVFASELGLARRLEVLYAA